MAAERNQITPEFAIKRDEYRIALSQALRTLGFTPDVRGEIARSRCYPTLEMRVEYPTPTTPTIKFPPCLRALIDDIYSSEAVYIEELRLAEDHAEMVINSIPNPNGRLVICQKGPDKYQPTKIFKLLMFDFRYGKLTFHEAVLNDPGESSATFKSILVATKPITPSMMDEFATMVSEINGNPYLYKYAVSHPIRVVVEDDADIRLTK